MTEKHDGETTGTWTKCDFCGEEYSIESEPCIAAATVELKTLKKIVAKLEAETRTERVCDWTQDDGVWHTGCGHTWEYANDGPVENGTRHCQYCGGTARFNPEQGEGVTK